VAALTASTVRNLTTAELEAVVCRLSRRHQPLLALGNDHSDSAGAFAVIDGDLIELR
jgi:hypothetical protein